MGRIIRSPKRNNKHIVYSANQHVGHWRDLPNLSEFVAYSNELIKKTRDTSIDRPTIHLVPPKESHSCLTVPVKGYRSKDGTAVFDLVNIEHSEELKDLIRSKCQGGVIEHHGSITYYVRLPKSGKARYFINNNGKEVPLYDWVIRSATFYHDGVLKIAVTYSFPLEYNAHRHVTEYTDVTVVFNEPGADYHSIAMGIVYSHRRYPSIVKCALAGSNEMEVTTMAELSRALNQLELTEAILLLTDSTIAKRV